LLATQAGASIVFEAGDAGEFLGTAQTALGAGPLKSIFGEIGSAGDQDVFRIRIADPASFSASTNNLDTALSQDSDTMLFLFDASGFGVAANDDDPDDPDALKARFPAGSFSGPPGIYLIAISIFRNVPRNEFAREIFPDIVFDDVALPAGSGSETLLHHWTFDPSPDQSGPYHIQLTGAEFIVPEPASWALFAAATALLFAARTGVSR
jgi:hypothetical protein